jgi:hypothetical protein
MRIRTDVPDLETGARQVSIQNHVQSRNDENECPAPLHGAGHSFSLIKVEAALDACLPED